MDTFDSYRRPGQEDASGACSEDMLLPSDGYFPVITEYSAPEQIQPRMERREVQPEPQPTYRADGVIVAPAPSAEEKAVPVLPIPEFPRKDAEPSKVEVPEWEKNFPKREVYRSPRKESPYADSPYVCSAPQEKETYVPKTEAEEKPKSKPAAKKKKKSGGRVVLSALLTILLVVAACSFTAYRVNKTWEEKNQASTDAMNQQILALQQQVQSMLETTAAPDSPTAAPGELLTPAQVYENNVARVVSIRVTVPGGTSSGTGFILTSDGYIVTNHHVVEDGTEISVVMLDETSYTAKVVGFDDSNDVAVLKIEAQNLPAVVLGSSDALQVGDMVVAIGNPLGTLTATQTVGYICGKDREITSGGNLISMLQTDAAINSGNSGGPLFNMRGEVVGITTAKFSGNSSSGASIEGIGFALPISDISGIIEDLKTHGYVTGAYLGITVQNLEEEFTQEYGISGIKVLSVEPGYAAARAGMQAKDIITALNGTKISSITDLTRGLRKFKAGDTVTITVIRNGTSLDLTVVLDEKPNGSTPSPTQPDREMPSEGDYDEWYDFFYGNPND